MSDLSTLLIPAAQIIWINILLSGDNAVVIALASRSLDPHRRKWAILLGSAVAVLLRIVFTIFIVEMLRLPYVKLASGLLLFWIAFGLLRDSEEHEVTAAGSIWAAVRTIAVADAIMSLDNVVAVAAAARNSMPLIIFGIAVSVPLIVFGSNLMLRLLNRFPVLVVLGAALLGWVAGEILAAEPRLEGWFGPLPDHFELYAAAGGALLVLAVAAALRVARSRRKPQPAQL